VKKINIINNTVGVVVQQLHFHLLFSSLSDPDLEPVRIQMGSGSRQTKMTTKKEKSEEISCFEVLVA
jgi:hypothetical protein